MRYKNIFIWLITSFIYTLAGADEAEDWAYARAKEASVVQTESLPSVEALSIADQQWINQQKQALSHIQEQALKPKTCGQLPLETLENSLAANENNIPQKSNSELLIFVSFSMPKLSLQAWARQATRAGGTLVLRGLVDNSMKKTVARIQELLGPDNSTGFTVDPMRFRQFKIESVPAVVVAGMPDPSCQQPLCPVPYDLLYGDVTLTYSLEKIVEEGEMATQAEPYLNRLKPERDKS